MVGKNRTADGSFEFSRVFFKSFMDDAGFDIFSTFVQNPEYNIRDSEIITVGTNLYSFVKSKLPPWRFNY